MTGTIENFKAPEVAPIHERLVGTTQELGRAHGLLSEILGWPEGEDRGPSPATLSSLVAKCQDMATVLADGLAKLRDGLGGSL
jgi:hypothetical protein